MTITRLGLHSRPARFALVGGVTTVAYLALYALLHLWLGSQVANAFALLLTADGNTLLNRRLTFGLRGAGHWRERVKGAVSFLVSLVLTSLSLSALAASGHDSSAAELVVLLVANGVAGVVHFLLLRSWAFTTRPGGSLAGDPVTA